MIEKKIVIVEDDRMIQKTLLLIFKENNYQISLFSKAEDVIQSADFDSIDLIISDLKLPGMNGLEMIERARKLGYTGKIILISAYPDLIDPQTFREFGIDNFFVKPLDLNKLNQTIHFLLVENLRKKSLKRWIEG